MTKKKQSPSTKGNHQKQSNNSRKEPLKIFRFGFGKRRQARIFLTKHMLNNINDKKALREPKACFKITGTQAIHDEPSIDLPQLYEAIATLRRANCDDVVINLPASPDEVSKGNKLGFYYIPDKYRGLAEKAIQKELGGRND